MRLSPSVASVRPIRSVESLGLTGEAFDDFYNKLTDQVVARGKQSQDPVEIAKKIAQAEIRAFHEEQANKAAEQTAASFTAEATSSLAKSRGKFPALETAMLEGAIDRSDVYVIAENLKKAGKPHDVEATLAFINGHFASQGGNSDGPSAGKPGTGSVGNATGTAGEPAGATTQTGAPPEAKTPVAAVPPATLSSNSPVVADEVDDEKLSLAEVLERAKAKARKRAGK
jgi:hypothetical protein